MTLDCPYCLHWGRQCKGCANGYWRAKERRVGKRMYLAVYERKGQWETRIIIAWNLEDAETRAKQLGVTIVGEMLREEPQSRWKRLLRRIW